MLLIPLSALRYGRSRFCFSLKCWRKFHFHQREIKKGPLCPVPGWLAEDLRVWGAQTCGHLLTHPLSAPQSEWFPTLAHVRVSVLCQPHCHTTAALLCPPLRPLLPPPFIPSQPPEAHEVKVAQSCPTLCNPMDYTVHGILQARILEWVAFPFSRLSSQPKDQTQVSHITSGFFTS